MSVRAVYQRRLNWHWAFMCYLSWLTSFMTTLSEQGVSCQRERLFYSWGWKICSSTFRHISSGCWIRLSHLGVFFHLVWKGLERKKRRVKGWEWIKISEKVVDEKEEKNKMSLGGEWNVSGIIRKASDDSKIPPIMCSWYFDRIKELRCW